MSLICSRAEIDECEPSLFFELRLCGTSSTGNSNTPFTLSSFSFVSLLSWFAYVLMPLSLLGRKTSRPMSFISDATLGFTKSLTWTFRAPRSGRSLPDAQHVDHQIDVRNLLGKYSHCSTRIDSNTNSVILFPATPLFQFPMHSN